MAGERAGFAIRNEMIVAGAGLAAFTLWLGTTDATVAGRGLDNGVQTGAALVAALACYRAARHSAHGARGWLLIAAAVFAWALGNVAWTIADLGGSEEGLFPSLADAGFLAFFPLAAAGLLLHPAAPRGRAASLRILVDGLIAAGAVRFIAWSLLSTHVHQGDISPDFDNAVGLGYAVADFAIVTIAVLVALRAPRGSRSPLYFLASGFALLGVADGVFTYLVVRDGYATGSLTDAMWLAGFLAVALGARLETVSVRRGGGVAQPEDETVPLILVPYTLVAPAVGFAIADAADGRMEPVLVWNVFVVGVLILARHAVDRVQNVRLVRSLRETVGELQRRDAQLGEAQEIARLGSWEWDLDRQAASWTDEVYRVLGLDRDGTGAGPEAFLGSMHPDDRDRLEYGLAEPVTRGESFEFDFRLAADGRIVHGRGRPVTDDSGRVIKLIGTVQDVTNVRRLAQELERRLAELERSNADLAHFASLASHDLAAPVQLLLGHLRLLRERTRTGASPEDAVLVQEAIRGAQRLDELIQDILCYSLAATGEDDLRSRVDTDRVVREAARTVGLDRHQGRLVVHGLPPIDAHPGQLRQLFQNLLSNALKFVPAARTPEIEVWAEERDGEWCFSVADNGVGVPEPDRERIFHMFERGESLDVRGAGIGLAICSRIVARHGGRIWVEETPRSGSVFRFTLPAFTSPSADLVLSDIPGL